jgi:hypothetical protein
LLFGEDAAFVEEAGNVDMTSGSGQVMAHRPPSTENFEDIILKQQTPRLFFGAV